MDDTQDHQLALKLMLEDIAALQIQQKGKQRAGEMTDTELAIRAMRNEILAARVFFQDRVLAARAGEAMHDNAIPELDDDKDETDPTQEIEHSSQKLDADDASLAPHVAEPTSECGSCLEQRQIFLVNACDHAYCRGCVRELYLGAIRDEELYPPRCCAEPFSPDTAGQVLGHNELDEFKRKESEYTSKNRVYCAEPGCSTFIPHSAIQDDVGTCPECNRDTHLTCGALTHPGVDCPLDSTLQNVLSMAKAEGWQRCYNCRAMVEIKHGCDHINCRCGSEFCYECGSVWKKCSCPLWHEHRLEARANQAVNNVVEANAAPDARRRVFNQAMERLRRHEDDGCRHQGLAGWLTRRRGDMECEACQTEMTDFIYECRSCMTRVCRRCRNYRLR